MQSYKSLKEERDLYKEIIEKQNETLQKIIEQIKIKNNIREEGKENEKK